MSVNTSELCGALPRPVDSPVCGALPRPVDSPVCGALPRPVDSPVCGALPRPVDSPVCGALPRPVDSPVSFWQLLSAVLLTLLRYKGQASTIAVRRPNYVFLSPLVAQGKHIV